MKIGCLFSLLIILFEILIFKEVKAASGKHESKLLKILIKFFNELNEDYYDAPFLTGTSK